MEERYQEEIIDEDSLAALFTERLQLNEMMDTKLELGFQSLLKTNTMVQHSAIYYGRSSSWLKQILHDNDDFAHLKLLLGEDYI